MRKQFRKWTALLLALVMAVSVGSALAEDDSPFVAAFKQWKANLDPNTQDYEMHLDLNQNDVTEAIDILLRKGDGIAEIAIPGVAKIQRTEGNLTVQSLVNGTEGIVLVFDLNSLKDLAQGNSFSPETVQEDVNCLKRLALRALTEVFLPFVTTQVTPAGMVLHIEMDEENLEQALVAFVDHLMEDGEDLDRLLKRYSSLLKLPGSLEELKFVWESYREIFHLPMMELNMDVAYDYAQKSVAVAGTMLAGNNYVDFSYNIIQEADGMSYSYAANGIMEGIPFVQNIQMLVGPEIYRMTMSMGPQSPMTVRVVGEKVENGYYASANIEDQFGNINGFDCGWYYYADTRSYSGFVGQTSPEKGWVSLAEVSGEMIPGGTTGTLTLPNMKVLYDLTKADTYLRGSFQIQQGEKEFSTLRVMIYPDRENLRVRADWNSSDAVFRGTMMMEAVKGKKISVKVTKPGEGILYYLLLEHQKTETGRTLHAEYLDRLFTASELGRTYIDQLAAAMPFGIEKFIRLLDQNKAAELNIQQSGDTLTMDGIWYSRTQTVSADATLVKGEGKTILQAEANLDYQDSVYPIENLNYRMTYVPHTVTFIDGMNFYDFTRVVDTEDQILWTLMRNKCVDLASIQMKLTEDGGFFYSEELPGISTALTMKPVEKTPIEPIDTTFGMLIDEKTIQLLAGQFLQ